MPNRYPIEILYCDEDGAIILLGLERPGYSALGETDDALVEVKTAIALWLETARAEALPIPEPAGRALNPS